MRPIAVLFAVLVGCGEVSSAGGAGAAGAAGTMQEADASGAAGTTGAGGGQAGASGTGGAIARTSCVIPIGQVSGTTTDTVWSQCGVQAGGGFSITVTNGAAEDYNGKWSTVGSYLTWAHSGGTVGDPTAPTIDGLCAVAIRYERPGSCVAPQKELLVVNLTVPAI